MLARSRIFRSSLPGCASSREIHHRAGGLGVRSSASTSGGQRTAIRRPGSSPRSSPRLSISSPPCLSPASSGASVASGRSGAGCSRKPRSTCTTCTPAIAMKCSSWRCGTPAAAAARSCELRGITRASRRATSSVVSLSTRVLLHREPRPFAALFEDRHALAARCGPRGRTNRHEATNRRVRQAVHALEL